MKKLEAATTKESGNQNRTAGTFPCCLYESSREISPAGFQVKHHWHDDVELLYFKSGMYRLIVNMEEFTIDEECFCFVNSGDLHAITMLEVGEQYALRYHPDLLSFSAQDTSQMKLLEPLARGALVLPQFIRISDLAFLSMKSAFDELVHYFETFGVVESLGHSARLTLHAASDQLMVKADILKILALLNSYGMINEKSGEPQRQVKVIKDAVTYIHENFRHKIYIRDLAELTGLNEQYFIRFFGNTLGKSPIEYINDYRVRQAQELLMTTEFAVTEIATACGFHNMGNFIKIFKDISGTTPLKYRKNGRRSRSVRDWSTPDFLSNV